MKKVLEAELLSIAHRILQMKNKDDVQNLYQEAKELYEKLLILKFHEDNFNLIQPNIANAVMESKLEKAYQEVVTERSQMPVDLMDEEYPIVIEAEVENHKRHQDDDFIQDQAIKVEVAIEESIEPEIPVKYTDAVVEQPFSEAVEKSEVIHYLESQEWTAEDLEEEQAMENTVMEKDSQGDAEQEIPEELEAVLNQHLINREGMVDAVEESHPTTTLEDSFFGIDYQDVDFVRIEEIDKGQELKNQLTFEPVSRQNNFEGELPVSEHYHSETVEDRKDRPRSLNDAFSQNITVSLNDRIAFEKYLFNGSAEDFNRVLSQLNTFNNLDQATAFIEDLVKPDYNYWSGKEEYVGRLMDLIEKRFA